MFVIDDPHARLETLDRGWQIDRSGKVLQRQFHFEDFGQTLRFINAVGYWAEQLQHHPDFEVGYNRCALRLTTHDAGGLTEKDFHLASMIDSLTPET